MARSRVHNPDRNKSRPHCCTDLVRPERLAPRELHFQLWDRYPQANWHDDSSCHNAHKPANRAAVPARGMIFIKFENATLVADVSTTTTSPGCIGGSSVFPDLMESISNRAAVRRPS